jgi:hypothetical protein
MKTVTEQALGVDFATLSPEQLLLALRLYADAVQETLVHACQFGSEMTGAAGRAHKTLGATDEPSLPVQMAVQLLILEQVEISGTFIGQHEAHALSIGQQLRGIFEMSVSGETRQ